MVSCGPWWARWGRRQPQILVQLLARLLHAGESAGDVLAAGRFVLAPPPETKEHTTNDRFSTWRSRGGVTVRLEGQVLKSWDQGLRAGGHTVLTEDAYIDLFGLAQLIDVSDELLQGATDPRPLTGAAVGW